jgi:hypothetical protein
MLYSSVYNSNLPNKKMAMVSVELENYGHLD